MQNILRLPVNKRVWFCHIELFFVLCVLSVNVHPHSVFKINQLIQTEVIDHVVALSLT